MNRRAWQDLYLHLVISHSLAAVLGVSLNDSLEACLASLVGGHSIVVARSNDPTHEAQVLWDGVKHVLALDGRVLHDTTSTVFLSICKHRQQVQTIDVGTQGHAKATAGV